MGFKVARLVAAALLFVAVVGNLPYDFYTLLRWCVCGVAAYGAFLAMEQGGRGWAWAFGILALFFNPLVPVHLRRETWAVIDVAAGLTMLVSLRTFHRPPEKR